MLSKNDIEVELGKGISISPLKESNIKENSINLTISRNAWATSNGEVYWDGKNKFTTIGTGNYKDKFVINKGGLCTFKVNNKQRYLLMLPHSTTVIITSEVIGVSDYIGGALHSKVGIVAKGIGHVGTMLGPGYCGHLMVSLHNISDEVIALPVGSTFVSLTLDYLKTSVNRTSSTVSGHLDKFAELGLKVDESTTSFLTEDWKTNFDDITDKMTNSDGYRDFIEKIKRNRWKQFLLLFSKENMITMFIIIVFVVCIYFACLFADKGSNQSIWVNRFWNVGLSGVVITLINAIVNLRRKR